MAPNDTPAAELDTSADAAVYEQLHSIRQSIDNIDAAVVHMLAERFKFTQQVGKLKAAHGLPPADPEREREQIQRLRALAEESHLDPAFAEKFLNFIVAEVIHHHERIAGSAADERAS
ncbi:chorismate mutase [Diaminobutyricibacter sp. McL0608]|uniref:chorismate mutase n=1 Tax=Leifsonia sp. McL0608 TaxID=3143537 RepID=UPI0031F3174D